MEVEAAAAALDNAEVDAVVPVIVESCDWTDARAVSMVEMADVMEVTCVDISLFS